MPQTEWSPAGAERAVKLATTGCNVELCRWADDVGGLGAELLIGNDRKEIVRRDVLDAHGLVAGPQGGDAEAGGALLEQGVERGEDRWQNIGSQSPRGGVPVSASRLQEQAPSSVSFATTGRC